MYAKNANTSAKANSTDFIDPKPWPNPTPVPLAKANKGDISEKKEPEAAPEAIAQTNATKNANVSKKANTTDFIDPKPFPNPTPVPLAKANKGDTPEKKEADQNIQQQQCLINFVARYMQAGYCHPKSIRTRQIHHRHVECPCTESRQLEWRRYDLPRLV